MFDIGKVTFWVTSLTGVGAVWLLGLGFLLLRFPLRTYRLLNWGKEPEPKDLKMVRVVGYLGLGFGFLFLVELVVRLLRSR